MDVACSIKSKKIFSIAWFIGCFCLLFIVQTSFAASQSFLRNPEVKQFSKQIHKKYGIPSSYLYMVFKKARYTPIVIEKMHHPYEAKPWYEYKTLFVTQHKAEEGAKFWHKYRKFLSWAKKEYGVPPQIIVAILGIETEYGKKMGQFRVLDTLATLAFYYPERAQFFKDQLKDFILLTYQNKMFPDRIYGSYAGAMGMPQFMPSSYLLYGVDYHGRKKPNIFKDGGDAIYSIARYLKQNGWERKQPIVTKAKLNGRAYKKLLPSSTNSMRPPHLSLNRLAKLGIYPEKHFAGSLPANLFVLKDKASPQYWLGFQNFYVIKTYNHSDLYAMAVVDLANQIKAYREKSLAHEA